MHPTTKKSTRYGVIIVVAAILINLVCFRISFWFIHILLAAPVILALKLKGRLSDIVLVSIFSIIVNSFTLTILYLLVTLFSIQSNIYLILLLSAGMAFFILSQVFPVASKFNELLSFIKIEKRDYDKIQNYPNLICTKHRSRTVLKKKLTFINIHCRINDNCDEKDIILTKQIVGLIGKTTEPEKTENNYYITVWNEHNKEITEADFDIIEIHKSEEIKNYDAFINKVINYFFNEIDRYKPITQVIVKVFEGIELSESTKRLMEKHFLKVEYVK